MYVFIHKKIFLYSQHLNIHIRTKVDIKINTTREYGDDIRCSNFIFVFYFISESLMFAWKAVVLLESILKFSLTNSFSPEGGDRDGDHCFNKDHTTLEMLI